MFGLLLITVGAKSCVVRAQSFEKKYNYYGYGLSLSVPQQTLSSNIPQLNGLKVTYVGCNAGGMLANNYGKIKANVGLYYSGSSTPYEMDVIRGSVSGNLYLLRLNGLKAHLFEPYVTAGVGQQMTKFYGNYLPDDPQLTPGSNSQPFLGKVASTRANIGVGVELQLENDYNKFIHVFTEITYGTSLGSFSSNSAFAQTKVTDAVTFNLGVNFGIVKLRR